MKPDAEIYLHNKVKEPSCAKASAGRERESYSGISISLKTQNSKLSNNTLYGVSLTLDRKEVA
jgi:hypothetical protein